MKTFAGKHSARKRQTGMGLATALFVITVMSLLAVLIFQLIRSNSETTGEQILLTRAFYAAESGVQFGVNGVFPPDMAGFSCPASESFALDVDGLRECTATVECASINVLGETYYTITSKGTCDGVSRTIQVRAK